MDSRLLTLLTNSASMSKISGSQMQLSLIFARAQLFQTPGGSGNANLLAYPQGIEELTPDQVNQIELYALATKLGMPTDGRALVNLATASSGPILDAKLPWVLRHIWFKEVGAY